MKKFIYELNSPENKKKKEKYVRDIFDSISPVYDQMNSLMSFGFHKFWRKYATRKLGISRGQLVLDGCCGTADFSIELSAKVGLKGKVIATDFSKGMLLKGVDKIRANHLARKNISPSVADTTALPFKDESFDVVTVGYGMRNLSDLEKGLREILRVLKTGGQFGCLDLAHPTIPVYSALYHLYFFEVVPFLGKLVSGDKEPYAYLPNSVRTFPNQQGLQKLMEKVGFKNVSYKNIAGGAIALHIGEKAN